MAVSILGEMRVTQLAYRLDIRARVSKLPLGEPKC